MTLQQRVAAWKQAREAEREAAAQIPFCSFDATPELTVGQYRGRVQGKRLTVWRLKTGDNARALATAMASTSRQPHGQEMPQKPRGPIQAEYRTRV